MDYLKQSNSLPLMVVVIVTLLVFLAVLFLQENKIRVLKTTAVELDHAFYDSKDGEFTWRRNDD